MIGAALVYAATPSDDETEQPKPTADAPSDDEPQENPLMVNAACYVCHIPFVQEEISRVHAKARVPCIDCHGLSAAHANDENVGATKPDRVYARDRIDKMCSKCHESHDVPARAVVARCFERKLSADTAAVCTDCHGQHRIERVGE